MLCRWPTTRWFSAEGMRPKYPMVGSFAGCCARKQGDAGIRLVTGLICINNEISLKDDVAHGVQATRAKSLNPPGISTYSGTCVDNTQSYPPAESVACIRSIFEIKTVTSQIGTMIGAVFQTMVDMANHRYHSRVPETRWKE